MTIPKKKILFICQQVAPYVVNQPQAQRCSELIQAVAERGAEIRTFMPKYGVVNERRNQLHAVVRLSGMNVIVDQMDYNIVVKVASMPSSRLQIYFIDNEEYFQRKAIMSDESGVQFSDNDERSRLFAKGVLMAVKMLRWEPEVVHCHGWFSALAAVYLKQMYAEDPIYANAKIVVSLDSDNFEGELSAKFMEALIAEGFDKESVEALKKPTYENLVKFVISYADGVIVATNEVDKKILDIAKKSNKPLLECESIEIAEDGAKSAEAAKYYDKYANFYDTI